MLKISQDAFWHIIIFTGYSNFIQGRKCVESILTYSRHRIPMAQLELCRACTFRWFRPGYLGIVHWEFLRDPWIYIYKFAESQALLGPLQCVMGIISSFERIFGSSLGLHRVGLMHYFVWNRGSPFSDTVNWIAAQASNSSVLSWTRNDS